jgi:hypothetical protein
MSRKISSNAAKFKVALLEHFKQKTSFLIS